MRIMVTGGTGFAGSHTVRRFIAEGHTVRLLVRDRTKVRRTFEPFGIAIPDHDIIVGDIVDEAAVNRAMAGCDAVYHGAALVSMKRSRAREILDTNARGVEYVVGGAHKRGLPSIVYVSSLSIFFKSNADPLSIDMPIAIGTTTYAQSKIAAEHYVRRLQDEGAPIRISYPTGIIGPEDPGLSEANNAVNIFFRLGGINTSTGFQIVDVRDLAEVHARMLELPSGAHRYAVAGPFLEWAATYRLLDEITGKRILRIPCPGPALRAAGSVGDLVKKFWDFEFPLTRDAMEYASRWPGTAENSTGRELDIEFRPARESFTDTIRWMYEAGHLTARQVGMLAH